MPQAGGLGPGDQTFASQQLDRKRMAQKHEETDAEVVAQFEERAKIRAVKVWICQDWVSSEERSRRLREIFGGTPELESIPHQTPHHQASPEASQ